MRIIFRTKPIETYDVMSVYRCAVNKSFYVIYTVKCVISCIGVGDGGGGAGAKTIFSGKNRVKFGHFVNFSRIYFRAKMSCPTKVD